MKKVLWLIVCLITMLLSVNGQRYYRHYYPRKYYYSRYYYPKTYYSYGSSENTTTSGSDNSWMKHFILFGFGVGGGTINPTGNRSHGTYDMDMIVMNALISIKLGSSEDTSHEYEISESDGGMSLQLGALIPIVTFDKSEYGLGQKGKIFIAPLIGFIESEDTIFDGHYMHDWHACSWWISDNHETKTSCTEYGGAVLVKYGCGFLLGKFTNKSMGLSIGLCI